MRRAIVGSVMAAALLVPAAAHGSGPPPTTASASRGVVSLGGGERYRARPTHGGTLVSRRPAAGGRIERSRLVSGRWGVPAVAQDGTGSGLAGDGRTFVLIHPPSTRTYPPRRTIFAILDAGTLRVRDHVTLPGQFSFDAISPDGATLYLIRYSGGDPTNYAVRAYDVGARRLLAKPIIDPHEPDEQMRGFPLTRTMSHDGTWAYTLYDGAGKAPFIHALDTRHRTARCIDVLPLAGNMNLGMQRLHVSADGGRITVTDGGPAVATVDTRTFRVSSPSSAPARAVPAPAPRPAAAQSDGGTGVPWRVIGGLVVALLLAGGAFAVANRRSRADADLRPR